MSITVGVDSYVDLDGADQYFDGRLFSDPWGQFDGPTRERAVKTATRQIDRLILKGKKASPTQTLEFPRQPDTEIPRAVQEACCEQALHLLSLNEYQRERELEHRLGMVGGSIGKANEYAQQSIVGSKRTQTYLCPEARELLRPWIAGAVSIR